MTELRTLHDRVHDAHPPRPASLAGRKGAADANGQPRASSIERVEHERPRDVPEPFRPRRLKKELTAGGPVEQAAQHQRTLGVDVQDLEPSASSRSGGDDVADSQGLEIRMNLARAAHAAVVERVDAVEARQPWRRRQIHSVDLDEAGIRNQPIERSHG
jgi:hypothetical protein